MVHRLAYGRFLQPIPRDPKDNGGGGGEVWQPCWMTKPFVLSSNMAANTVVFLNLQGLVANHLLVKLHKHTHLSITSFLYFCLCLKVCNWNWNIYKSLLQIYTVLHYFSYVHNSSEYRSQETFGSTLATSPPG